MASSSSDSSIRLSTTVEYQHVVKDATDLYLMASLKAPTFSNPEETRVPIDLVCVIDRSGSMQGEKIALVKSTLDFMITQLCGNDRLGLVSFDTNVTVDTPLLVMSDENKKVASEHVGKLIAGSSTNLSGGMLQGMDLLKTRKSGGNDVASVLVFTDGQANHGITRTEEIVRALSSKLEQCSRPISVFSFGFGEDHDANMLKAIAEAGHGMYYYIANADEIPKSFGECLGGLLSVVAQNVQLRISALNGATIKKVYGRYTAKDIVANQQVQVTIPDMYSEEQKDVMFQIELPSISAASSAFAALSPADVDLLQQLIENAKQGHWAIVNHLLPSTSHLLNIIPPTRMFGLIHQVAWHGESALPTLQSILSQPGTDINLRSNKEGKTALHCAAERGFVSVCAALLEAGANPCARTNKSETPCALATTEELKALLTAAEAGYVASAAAASPASSPTECDIIRLDMEYFNVMGTRLEASTDSIKITRVDILPHDQVANFELDKQRNRIEMSEVLAKANALSSSGKLEEGKALLVEAIAKIKKSVSASDRFCINLVRDLEQCLASMRSMHEYRSRGSKMMSETSHVQSYQRSTHAAYMTSGDSYRTVSKREMAKRFAREDE